MSLSHAEIKKITFFYERWRALATGIIETANTTFVILIALRFFSASNEVKALLASGGAMGLLLSPLPVSIAQRFRWTAAYGAGCISLLGAFGFLIAAWVHWLPLFVIGCLLGLICMSCHVPLFTQMLQDNYPDRQRGRLTSRSFMIRILAATAFSQLGGWLLLYHISLFPWLFSCYSIAFLGSAFCFFRCPSHVLHAKVESALRSSLAVLRHDTAFRNSLITWMLGGFGSVMMLSLRVEFLANPAHGLALSSAMIAVFTGVLPDIVRFVMAPVWGRIFDRFNIFILQIVLNLIFASAYLMFFTGTNWIGLSLGAMVFGLASSGSDIAWSLWATKFAAPDRVAEYMAVHTFLAGTRGVAAPFVAFSLLRFFPIHIIVLFSGALILAGTMSVMLQFRGKPDHKLDSSLPVEGTQP